MLERYYETYNDQRYSADMHFNWLSYVCIVVEISFFAVINISVCFIYLLCNNFSVKLVSL